MSLGLVIDNDANSGGRSRRRGRIGETAGECAAVCCCCPCVAMHVVILAVYSIPTALCRKAWRRRKRQMLLKRTKKVSLEKTDNRWRLNSFGSYLEDYLEESTDGEDFGPGNDDVAWDRFYGAGFWRTASQRADP